MRNRRHAALAALTVFLGLTCAASATEPAYVGVWSKTSVHCSTQPNRPGAPMIVTATGFRQHHLECTFAKVEATAPGAWQIAADCTWNGSPARMEMTWAVAEVANGATLTLTDAAGTHVLSKCVPPPRQAPDSTTAR